MIKSVAEFVESLASSAILSREEADRFRAQGHTDINTLAAALLTEGRLTTFQAGALLADPPRPIVLDEYILLEKIGAGGMGEVFRARHRRLDRFVALKTLLSQSLATPEAIARFQREVTAAARLQHPHIVAVHDARECQGIHFYVMELVEGENASSFLRDRGVLSIGLSVEIVRQAAEGLAYAHECGVVHRDIKPANLLLSFPTDSSSSSRGHARRSSGRSARVAVKVLDLGLARVDSPWNAPHDAAAEHLTQTGQVMGTIDYMAPEQARDTRTADARADIYSLGCTLYRFLVGKPPFEGDTFVQKILAHAHEPVPKLRDQRADVPEEIADLCQRMMAKDPADRPQSMEEVIEALSTERVLACVAAGDEGTTDYRRGSTVGRGNDLATNDVSIATDGRQQFRDTTTIHKVTLPTTRAMSQPRWLAAGVVVTLLVAAIAVRWSLEPTDNQTAAAGGTPPVAPLVNPSAEKGNDIDPAAAPESPPIPEPLPEPPVPEPRPPLVIVGDWQTLDGEIMTSGKLKGHCYVHFGDREWTDYDFSCEMLNENVKEESGDMMGSSVVVLAQSEKTYWTVNLGAFNNHRHFDLLPSIDGDVQWGGGARRWLANRLPEKDKEWLAVKVAVRKGTIEITVNDDFITSSSDPAITHGCVGISAYNLGKARWRNFVVRDLDGKVLWEGLPTLPQSPE